MRLWLLGGALVAVWLILLLVGKSGFIHILLLTAISIFGIQLLAHRKTKYHRGD